MTRLTLGFVLVALLAAALAAQDAQEIERLYRAATLAQADGECTTAARQYAAAVETPNRELAAKALLGLAQCSSDAEALRIYWTIPVTPEQLQPQRFRPPVGIPRGGWSPDSRSILFWTSTEDSPAPNPHFLRGLPPGVLVRAALPASPMPSSVSGCCVRRSRARSPATCDRFSPAARPSIAMCAEIRTRSMTSRSRVSRSSAARRTARPVTSGRPSPTSACTTPASRGRGRSSPMRGAATAPSRRRRCARWRARRPTCTTAVWRPNQHPLLDPQIRPLRLTPEEKHALVRFLEALTGHVRDG